MAWRLSPTCRTVCLVYMLLNCEVISVRDDVLQEDEAGKPQSAHAEDLAASMEERARLFNDAQASLAELGTGGDAKAAALAKAAERARMGQAARQKYAAGVAASAEDDAQAVEEAGTEDGMEQGDRESMRDEGESGDAETDEAGEAETESGKADAKAVEGARAKAATDEEASTKQGDHDNMSEEGEADEAGTEDGTEQDDHETMRDEGEARAKKEVVASTCEGIHKQSGTLSQKQFKRLCRQTGCVWKRKPASCTAANSCADFGRDITACRNDKFCRVVSDTVNGKAAPVCKDTTNGKPAAKVSRRKARTSRKNQLKSDIERLTSLGISKDNAKVALKATNNDVDQAARIVLQIVDDDNSAIETLTSLGFSKDNAKKALNANNNDVDRAATMLFHQLEQDEKSAKIMQKWARGKQGRKKATDEANKQINKLSEEDKLVYDQGKQFGMSSLGALKMAKN